MWRQLSFEVNVGLYWNAVSTLYQHCFNVETSTDIQRCKYAYSTFFQHFNVGFHSTFKFWFESIQRWTIDDRSRLKICCVFNVFSTLKISTFIINVELWLFNVAAYILPTFIVETMLRACWDRFPKSNIFSRNFL